MDLDSSAYYKLVSVRSDNTNFTEYRRIIEALGTLGDRYDHETPEMWCSRIRDPFKKILKENPRILSGDGYIKMYGKLIESSDRVNHLPSNYIYCSVCDSLVFISETPRLETCYRDNHLKRCINGDIISNEHARKKDILQSIDEKEATIWVYKQYILREEAKLNRLRLELFSQSTSHSEKDKMASISYNYDTGSVSYEAYLSAKATIAENTLPNSYHVLNQKSRTFNEPTPPPLPQKPVELMGECLPTVNYNVVQVHLRLEIFGMIDQICLIFLAGLVWEILLKHISILCEKMRDRLDRPWSRSIFRLNIYALAPSAIYLYNLFTY